MNIRINTTTILIAVAIFFLFRRQSNQSLISGGVPIPDDMTPTNNSYGV